MVLEVFIASVAASFIGLLWFIDSTIKRLVVPLLRQPVTPGWVLPRSGDTAEGPLGEQHRVDIPVDVTQMLQSVPVPAGEREEDYREWLWEQAALRVQYPDGHPRQDSDYEAIEQRVLEMEL
jgi:hypothetical protein|tara:strand:+ start:9114 stop:9479 length:366 start_codon:yes stop_codon:yes gene_type:complete